MTRFVSAIGLCAVAAALGCSQKPYVSQYPETARGGCSIPSSVFECDHHEPARPVVETQQGAVGAEAGMSDEEAARMRALERETLSYPSPYGQPNR